MVIGDYTMEENEMTTIAITNKTRDELEKLKIHPNQSFEEVIAKILKERK